MNAPDEAINRILELHRPIVQYSDEYICPLRHIESHTEQWHEEGDGSGYFCKLFPVTIMCSECRWEDGSVIEYPCETVQTIFTTFREHAPKKGQQ